MRLLRWFWVNLLTWSVEKCPTSFRLHRDVFSCRIKLQQSRRHLSILIALPFLVISGEITGDGAFDISATIKAIAAVTITKARSASKVIVCVYQEMTGFANVAFFSFHILFAGANASLLVALGNVINASFGFAFTTIKSAIYCTKLLRSESRLNITYHSQCSQSSNSWQRTCHTFHQSLLAYIRICHPEHIGVVSSLNQIKTQVHLKWKCKIVSSVKTNSFKTCWDSLYDIPVESQLHGSQGIRPWSSWFGEKKWLGLHLSQCCPSLCPSHSKHSPPLPVKE